MVSERQPKCVVVNCANMKRDLVQIIEARGPARGLARAVTGNNKAIKMPIIVITTSNSTNVNATSRHAQANLPRSRE